MGETVSEVLTVMRVASPQLKSFADRIEAASVLAGGELRKWLADELSRFHQNSCYPEAMEFEIAGAASRIIAKMNGGTPAEWIKTDGKEPLGWSRHDFIWVAWNDGDVQCIECYGVIAWDEIAYYQPVTAPNPPEAA